MKTENGITSFWKQQDAFSNWYIRPFTVKGISFNCGEQSMISKAMFFKDTVTAALILKELDPREQKKLGREVSNFVKAEWDNNCVKILAACLVHKFNQHEDFRKLLISTKGTELVEASPYDRIWGIGIGVNDPRFSDRTQWGENLLGKVLEIVRSHLLKLEMVPKNKGPSFS